MVRNKETHPSYATLAFSRTSGGSVALFGSSIQHRDTIRMYVRDASINRHLNNDWISGENTVLEVEMSYSQFAEAITSMNQGTGVPVTLRYMQGMGRIEECPFIDKRKQFEEEFSGKLNSINTDVDKLIMDVAGLFEDKKAINKGDRKDILNKLMKIKQNIGVNSEFVYNQFNEQMDKTVRESKGEIEAFFQNKINSIANIALVEYKDELTSLDNPIDAEMIK